MNCNEVRENLSAALDGEVESGNEGSVLAHLASCGDCSRWHAQVVELRTRVSSLPQPPMPDRTASIMGAIAESKTRTSGLLGGARFALAFCGLAQLATALGSLAGLPVIGHSASELLIFELAMVAAFVAVAWKPERAWGMLPFLVVVAGGIALTATIDVIRGAATIGAESGHITEIVGVALVWLVASNVRTSISGRFATA